MLKKIWTFLIAAAVIAAVAATGYFFAKKKSEPLYQSKIDRVMFDRKNKVPGFIMRLPDKEPLEKKNPILPKEEEDTSPRAIEAKALLDKIPLVAKLPKNSVQSPLKHINADKNLLEENDGVFLPKIGRNGEKAWIDGRSSA